MPYISPSLSPTKAFASTSSTSSRSDNGPKSAHHLMNGNGDRAPSSSPVSRSSSASSTMSSLHLSQSQSQSGLGYVDGYPTSSAGSMAYEPQYSQPTHSRRPMHRHHSRSHSSDTLVTLSQPSSSSSATRYSTSKATPDYIFVQPASPGVNGESGPITDDGDQYHQYHSQQQPSTGKRAYGRPSLRHAASSSRHASFSASSYGAGDEGDVAPPKRSSSSSSLHSAQSPSSSSQAPLPAPSSSAAANNRRARRQFSASADSSPRSSIWSLSPLAPIRDELPSSPTYEEREQEEQQLQATQQGDSALATSSSEPSTANSSDGEQAQSLNNKKKPLSPILQRHKPSWGEIPGLSNTSMMGSNASTSFSFGNSPISSSAASDASTPTPRAEKRFEEAIGGAYPGAAGDAGSWPAANGLVAHFDAAAAEQPAEGEFDAGEEQTQPSTESSSSTRARGVGFASASAGGSPKQSSGALAPAVAGSNTTKLLARPAVTKAFSEQRSESPFRLELEQSNHWPLGSASTHHHAGPGHNAHTSSHSRIAGSSRQREVSESALPSAMSTLAGNSTSALGPTGNGTGSLHGPNAAGHHPSLYSHGGLTVHTHHPLHHLQHAHHTSRSSSYRPSPLPTPMLRKKSGELVKSSMKHDSRARSAPTTPTGPKAVHFDEQLERVKLFLAQQKPTAVSRDGSPQETETEDDSEVNAFPFPPMTTSIPAQITLVLTDFPKNQLPDIGNRDLCMESLEIAADSKSLKGTALLRNLAFEKRLSIRFTFDDWQTVSEVTGEWQSTLIGGAIDRWSFRIKLDDMLARIEDKKLFLALRYTVGGRDIWDSNYDRNYRAEFRKQAARSQAVVGGSRAARHEWAVTNAGQANERMADLRRELDRLVAGNEDDDFSSADELVISNNGSRGFKYQPRFVGGEAVPLAHAPASNTFSSRYDFGASLKKAGAPAGSPLTQPMSLAPVSAAATSSAASAAATASSAQARGSPQSAHAVLHNPYFAAPNASDAMISSWRNAASVFSPPQSNLGNLAPMPSPMPGTNDILSPKSQHQSLYADDNAPLLSTAIMGATGPAKTFDAVEPSVNTPPATFTGSTYYPRTESNGVISQDFGLPNLMAYMNMTGETDGGNVSPRTEVPLSSSASSSATATPGSYFPAGDPISSTNSSASNSTTPSVEHSPTIDFSGGAPLMRQNRYNSFPPSRNFLRDLDGLKHAPSSGLSGSSTPPISSPALPDAFRAPAPGADLASKLGMYRQHSGSSLVDMLDASLMSSSADPRDSSIYSPAISPRSTSPPISSSAEIPGAHQRRHSPPRPSSPGDLLSPSPSSASTDTSISTPQSPGGSPPLKMYSPFLQHGPTGGRPDMGSDTYFNFVHRYCWGNGDSATMSSSSSSSSSHASTSTALGLAGLNPSYEIATPKRITPPSSCSASLLSSPAQSPSGSRTPSPRNLSPSLETVQRMDAKGFMSGPQIVQI